MTTRFKNVVESTSYTHTISLTHGSRSYACLLQFRFCIVSLSGFKVVNVCYKIQLECGPMPNVMAALSNIGGALCLTPQSLVGLR